MSSFLIFWQTEAKRKEVAVMTNRLCHLVLKHGCGGDEDTMQRKFPELKGRMNGLPAGEKTFG